MDMLTELKKIMLKTGELSIKLQEQLRQEVIEYKSETDLVTPMDKAIESFLKDQLLGLVPDASFWGEEGGTYGDCHIGKVFIVDPLDGTTNYVHRHPYYSISVAYREDGKTKLGLVYAPRLHELYYAIDGEGAFMNDQRIHVSNNSVLLHALVATGFACVRSRLQPNNLPIFSEMVYRVRDIRRCGSAAIDLCYVARGIYDLFWERNLSPWDIAAGVLIVKEAGGIVTDFAGGEDFESKRELVASNGAVHDSFLKLIASYQSHGK